MIKAIILVTSIFITIQIFFLAWRLLVDKGETMDWGVTFLPILFGLIVLAGSGAFIAVYQTLNSIFGV